MVSRWCGVDRGNVRGVRRNRDWRGRLCRDDGETLVHVGFRCDGGAGHRWCLIE